MPSSSWPVMAAPGRQGATCSRSLRVAHTWSTGAATSKECSSFIAPPSPDPPCVSMSKGSPRCPHSTAGTPARRSRNPASPRSSPARASSSRAEHDGMARPPGVDGARRARPREHGARPRPGVRPGWSASATSTRSAPASAASPQRTDAASPSSQSRAHDDLGAAEVGAARGPPPRAPRARPRPRSSSARHRGERVLERAGARERRELLGGRRSAAPRPRRAPGPRRSRGPRKSCGPRPSCGRLVDRPAVSRQPAARVAALDAPRPRP